MNMSLAAAVQNIQAGKATDLPVGLTIEPLALDMAVAEPDDAPGENNRAWSLAMLALIASTFAAGILAGGLALAAAC